MFDLNNRKLVQLVEIEGFEDPMEFLQANAQGSQCPAICSNIYCDATADLEPDQRAGYCEQCDTNTMQSGLVLAGII